MVIPLATKRSFPLRASAAASLKSVRNTPFERIADARFHPITSRNNPLNPFHSIYFSSFSTGVCPLLCNGHGDYVNGECVCQPGWKGKECNLRYEECEVTDCNGHGHCVEGTCQCIKGFAGDFCEKGQFAVSC